MKRFFRSISVALIVTMMATLLPAQMFAEKESKKTEDKVEQKKPEAKIIGEVVEKREKNVKHFMKDDGTFEAVVYPEAVHYKDVQGKWQDIDNSLQDAKGEGNNDVLENKSSDFKIKIAKKADSDKLVTIKKDNYEVSWGLEGAENSSAEVVKKDITAFDAMSENEKKTALTNIDSAVNFTNVSPNVDLKYMLKSKDLKEYITINEKIDNPQFVFNLNDKNMVPEIKKDNSIVFYDEKDNSKEIFSMAAPFMYDAKGVRSDDVKLQLDADKNGYKLTVVPNNDWYSSSERMFPITIDPSIYVLPTNSIFKDTYVDHWSPNSNYNSVSDLYIDGRTNYEKKVFMSFVLPQLSTGDFVTSALFAMHVNNTNPDLTQYLIVHKVLGAWDANSITWNNKPNTDTQSYDYQSFNNYSPGSGSFNITAIVKDWYLNGNNYGIMFDTTDQNKLQYYPSENSYFPCLTLNYTNNSGLENYWTYHSQSIGRAGTGYVNDANGNFVLIHNDTSISGNRMPVSINHVYNTNNRLINNGFGYGWSLNYSQSVTSISSLGYKFIDEDGTEHYFNSSYYDPSYGQSVMVDEDGLGLKLIVSGDPNIRYTIVDKGGNKLKFNSSGRLASMNDSNGNSITLEYSGTTLIKITDGASRITNLNYTNGNLSSIESPNNSLLYDYENGRLSRITYKDNKCSKYLYDSDNNVTDVVNIDGYKMSYTYYNETPRVKSIQEAILFGSSGQKLDVDYKTNVTKYTDLYGKSVAYQFNNRGNTTCILDSDGNAQYYEFLTGSNVNNKLSLQSKLQTPIMNLLKNHNCETDTDWSSGSNGGSIGTCEFTPELFFAGNRSLKITKSNNIGRQYYSQQLHLNKGTKYTVSAYIRTTNLTNVNSKGASIYVTYQNSSGIEQKAESSFAKGTSDWQRYDVSFTLPSDALVDTVNVNLGLSEETGWAYFDCIQLETGPIANRYNFVENPDFKYGNSVPDFWNVDYRYCDINTDFRVSQADVPLQSEVLDQSCFKIIGGISKTKIISQTIYTQGNAGDVFTVGTWAKADSIALKFPSTFDIQIAFQNKYNSSQQAIEIPFNDTYKDWQYLSSRATSNIDYKSIIITLYYTSNLNEAYFDGIQLYKEEFGERYQYDSNGNMSSVGDLESQNSQFEYDTNNDLTKNIDSKGNIDTAGYDSKHNLTSSTSAENVSSLFGYDSYGNQLWSTVGNYPDYTMSTSQYTTNGNYKSNDTDPAGNVTSYEYNSTTGNLDSVTDAKSKSTCYLYDNMNRMNQVIKSADGQYVSNTYDYADDKLSKITHNGFSYNFDYDLFGNMINAKVGSQSLISNEYAANNGDLLSSTYGNGQKIGYSYDSNHRITEKKQNDVVRYKYDYDKSGNIGYQDDKVNNTEFKYNYDNADRLVKLSDSLGNSSVTGYDATGNVNKLTEKIGTSNFTTQYEFDKDNRPKKVTANNNSTIDYFYDNKSNLRSTTLNTGAYNYNTQLWQCSGVNGYTRNIQSITNNGSTIQYTYDANNNIQTISKSGQVIKYYYNELNEVTREDNQVLNKTITYSYDVGGNILTKTEYPYTTGTPTNPTKTVNYAYDSTWKDKITGYDDKTITYDEIGNPLTYGTNYATFSPWSNNGGLVADVSSTEPGPVNASKTWKLTKTGTGSQWNGWESNYGGIFNCKTGDCWTISGYYKTNNSAGISSLSAGAFYKSDWSAPYNTTVLDSNLAIVSDGNWHKFSCTIRANEDFSNAIVADGPSWGYSSSAGVLYVNGLQWVKTGVNSNSWSYSWEEGRQLSGMTGNGYTISYKYNDQGIRTSKTVNGVTTTYHLVGDKVTYESNGTDSIYYTYDANDKLISLNLNGTEYYYIYNAQGDIIGMFDGAGTQVVSYTYDTWGKLISIDGTMKDTVGVKNPYRYRGYRYDTETGLYYCQSRYYNPEWGRWLNADSIVAQPGELLSANMFCYCLNNPVNRSDPSGCMSGADCLRYLPLVALMEESAAYVSGLIASTLAPILSAALWWCIYVVPVVIAAAIAAYYIWKTVTINNTIRSIPSKLKDGNKVDLSKFTTKGPKQPKGGRSWLGPLGWYIVKDLDNHKGSIWKLFNWAGQRIASLAADGRIVGK